jgi:hypothetical protein
MSRLDAVAVRTVIDVEAATLLPEYLSFPVVAQQQEGRTWMVVSQTDWRKVYFTERTCLLLLLILVGHRRAHSMAPRGESLGSSSSREKTRYRFFLSTRTVLA